MLEQLIAPNVEEIQDCLKNNNGNLKMTTNWIVNNGEELIFSHEMLGIPFKNMQVIVNALFFKPWRLFDPYPTAYQEISKNVKWGSVDTLVKQGEKIEVNPIAFISLVSCFKGKDEERQINLHDVIKHLTYPNTEKMFIVALSSEEDVKKKENEIKLAKNSIIDLYEYSDIEEFNISEEGGGYRGFCASF